MEKKLFRVIMDAKSGIVNTSVTVYVLAPNITEAHNAILAKYPEAGYSVNYIEFINEEIIEA